MLPMCLASLASQDVPLEIAVMDASDDERVRALVDTFADSITVRYHGPDDGQADAIANGWDRTSGSVLGWLNADDVLAPGALRHAADSFLEKPELDVVYGHSLICNDDGYINGYHWNVLPPGDHILSTCCISQPSCFFRRSALEAAGGLDRSLHFTMDWDLWIRLHKSGAKFCMNEDIFSLVLWSEEAKTGGFGRQRRVELKRILDQNESIKERLTGYLGFASHYFYEYVLPRRLRNWIWRRNISGGRGMFGLSVSGDIDSLATFVLFHFDDDPKKQIEVKTSARAEEFELRFEGEILNKYRRSDDSFWFTLSTPFQGGKVGRLQLENRSVFAIHIDGIRFPE